jgi:hypothetical protein
MAVDYNRSKQQAGTKDAEALTFAEYLGGFSSRIAGLAGSSGSVNGLPTALIDMMPKPPEGWTVRPADPADIASFLPKDRGSVPKKAMEYLESVVAAAGGRGVESVALTYERGDRMVVFQAVRYPNAIFTSLAAIQQRFELQMRGAEFSGTQFMTVRGLDIAEDLLPEEARARFFFANVGAQIHLRVLAPKRMRDDDMVPFFQTLHVAAMNASVIDKQDGLGEVPVIVLASGLDETTRAAYEADIARRAAELAAARDAVRLLAEAKVAEEAAAAAGEPQGGGMLSGLFGGDEPKPEAEVDPAAGTIKCVAGADGAKRCKVVAPVEN